MLAISAPKARLSVCWTEVSATTIDITFGHVENSIVVEIKPKEAQVRSADIIDLKKWVQGQNNASSKGLPPCSDHSRKACCCLHLYFNGAKGTNLILFISFHHCKAQIPLKPQKTKMFFSRNAFLMDYILSLVLITVLLVIMFKYFTITVDQLFYTYV